MRGSSSVDQGSSLHGPATAGVAVGANKLNPGGPERTWNLQICRVRRAIVGRLAEFSNQRVRNCPDRATISARATEVGCTICFGSLSQASRRGIAFAVLTVFVCSWWCTRAVVCLQIHSSATAPQDILLVTLWIPLQEISYLANAPKSRNSGMRSLGRSFQVRVRMVAMHSCIPTD